MKQKFFGLLIAMLFIFVLTACGSSPSTSEEAPADTQENDSSTEETTVSSEDPIKLTYAFFAPANTFPAVQMQKWKDELEARTDGKVEVELFPGGSLLQANNMYDGIRNKVADIGLSVTSYEPGMFPLMGISDMPSGYPSGEVASLVVNELVELYPPEAFDDMKIITSFATEAAYLQSADPIASLDDLSGVQLRISGSLTPIMEALGAAPVGMSNAEVAEAVQTGVVRGNVSSREVLMDLSLAENLKYVTDYPLTVSSFIAVMNQDTWNSLPNDVQEVINDLNKEMGQFAGAYLDSQVQEAMNWSRDEHGLEVVSLTDASAWDERVGSLQDDLVAELEEQGYPAEEYKEKLYELIEKYSNQ
ncbi:TRAP transporter substrate-binding protein [Alkalihalobacillus sp. MEB130]|nr:TRAP transporter substrate-binding protein [Alkalihalobacillus sp. MEB130]